MLHDYVSLLVERGYVEVAPRDHGISPAAIKRANEAIEFLVTSLSRFGEQAAVTRDGEHEPDLLLMVRNGQAGMDRKQFLHIAHDLEQHLPDAVFWALTEQEKNELEVVKRIYFELNRFVAQVVNAVFATYPYHFSGNVPKLYSDAAVESQPYATSSLRGLWYPPQDHVGGAKAHFDRSFLTAHCGDEGGSLNAHRSLRGGSVVPISPQLGNIVLFWGIKALEVSKGKLTPLYHSASTLPHTPRRALVFFGQIQTTVPVVNGGERWTEYCRDHGIDNPNQWYAKRMG